MRDRIAGRQITVRRFGWSDESLEAAQANADERARDGLARIAAGEKVAKRDLKRAYNGSAGVPIREEIVETFGDFVITRNCYGARCLNTPNVLFADIDFEGIRDDLGGCLLGLTMVLGFGAVIMLTARTPSYVPLALAIAVSAGLAIRTWRRRAAAWEPNAQRRLHQFLKSHPDWHLRLYRTPAGYRVLAMHRTFDPADPAVSQFFQAIRTDRIYQQMCRNQRCFRARVSPKPWRIPVQGRLRPSPGIWPVKPEYMPGRLDWVRSYEQVSRGYAACRFVEALGATGVVDPAAREVQEVHDRLCRATSGLPLA